MTPFERSLRERFPLPGDGDPIPALRRSALARFAELGLPTTALEEWRYTSLSPLAALEFEPARPGAQVPRSAITRWELGEGSLHVFVDGRYRPELSSAAPTDRVFVGSLAAALRERPQRVGGELSRHADFRKDALTALNTAFAEDGAFVDLGADARVPSPIHLLFLSTSAARPTLSQPRNLIVAGPGSEATIVETYAAAGAEGIYFTNAVSEIALGTGARIGHFKIQEEGGRAFHAALTQVTHGKDSRFASHAIALGAALARNEVRALFAGEGGDCTLNGLYLGTGAQHLDNRTLIDHKSSRCTSRELYKGILDGEARGVFGGRVLVREDAQKTDARQINRNLLLSEGATVDTKPQLEIFADDVKCAHGAAVGALDEDALFYLRSRGLSREVARSLLTYAFASEVVDLIPLAPLRSRVRELVVSRLPGGAALLEAA